jgi:hypothetical protein
MLYQRDFTKLTDEEIELWQKAETAFAKAKHKAGISAKDYDRYFSSLPLAALHARELFPNNYLRTGDLKGNSELLKKRDEFKILLESGAGERSILNFIRDEEAAFIVGSIFKSYNFGHHIAFAFREFELPPYYKVDFLLVGKNSMGYEFIFVEFESPTGSVTTGDGDFGDVIRKGLKQIEEWDAWIEANYATIKLVYNKMIMNQEGLPVSVYKRETQLPGEFYELDKTRIHFAVVAGRRKDFSAKTYRKKRKLSKERGILLLHYDNLLDSAEELIKHGNY